MNGKFSTTILFFSLWLFVGCVQEEGKDSIPKEVQLQKSLERINMLLEKSEKGEGAMLQDIERLREIKAGLEKELSAQRAAK